MGIVKTNRLLHPISALHSVLPSSGSLIWPTLSKSFIDVKWLNWTDKSSSIPCYSFDLTRYRGRGLLSHVLPACGLGGKTLLAAGLAALLLYLDGHPLKHGGYYWKLLFLSSALYALFKSLGVLVRATHHFECTSRLPLEFTFTTMFL